MTPMTTTDARKRHTENTTPKETPMTSTDLHVIREEAITTSNLVAEIRDLIESNAQRDNDEMAEQTATLHVIRDLLDERSRRAQTRSDNRDTFKHEAETTMRGHGDCCDAPDEAHITLWRGDEVERLLAANRDLIARAETAEADVERHSKSADKWCNLYADKCEEVERLTRERDEWRGRAEKVEHTEAERGSAWKHAAVTAQRRRLKAEAERDEWKAKYEQTEADLANTEIALQKMRDWRDKWKAKFEQTDNLLSRTRDERDEARQDVKNARRETEVVKKIELRTHQRYEALRADVGAEAAYRSTDGIVHPAFTAILTRDDKRGGDHE